MTDDLGSDSNMDGALDRYWEATVQGRRGDLADQSLASAFAATIRLIHSGDKAPSPSRAFVRRLRDELMAKSLPTAVPRVDADSLQSTSNVDAIREMWSPWVRRSEKPRRWLPIVELAAVAALIVALVSGTFGNNAWLRELWQNDAAAPADDSPIGMYRGDAARTGVMPGPGPEGSPELAWRHEYPDLMGVEMGSPVVAGTTIYIVDGEKGRVNAFDVATGEFIWSTTVGFINESNPAVANGLVFVATLDPALDGDAGYLVALDSRTGRERWRYKTEGTEASAPVVSESIVYVESNDESLRAVDALTGRELWRLSLKIEAPVDTESSSPEPRPEGTPDVPSGTSYLDYPGGVHSPVSPAVANGLVYTSTNAGMLLAVNARTGEEVWRFQTKGNMLYTPAVETSGDHSMLFVTVTKALFPIVHPVDGWVYAVDAKTGRERWSWRTGRDVHSAAAVSDGTVYVAGIGHGGRSLVALDGETGSPKWSSDVSDQTLVSSPVIGGEIIYVEDLAGRLFAIDRENGDPRWIAETGVSIEPGLEGPSPVVVNGLVIVGSVNRAVQSSSLIAIGSAQTRSATPTAGRIPRVDVSGLPACTVAPRDASASYPVGTPSATVVPIRGDESSGQPAQMLLSEIPDGAPATSEEIAGIRDTLESLLACARPGDEMNQLALFTDDYFRRVWVRVQSEHSRDGSWQTWTPGGREILAFENPRKLPDGRVGIVIRFNGSPGSYIVFSLQDDRWLVDETFEIVERLGAKG